MRTPGFSADQAIGAARGRYAGRWIAGSSALAQPALTIWPGPINICEICPECCAPQPSIGVNWLNCNNSTGYVLVTGKNFAANSGVQAEVGNCSGPYPVPVGASTDANGSFTAWVPCDCSGSTTVTAIDSSGNSAQGSAAMPC